MPNGKIAITTRISVAFQIEYCCLYIRSYVCLAQLLDELIPIEEAENIVVASERVHDCCTVVVLVCSPCRVSLPS
jgi:hypothetical protein